jgi:hypothetical protein
MTALPQGRLLEAAAQAAKSNPGNWDGANAAFYAAIKDDAELLQVLFERYRRVAMQKPLTAGAALVREQEGQAPLPRPVREPLSPASQLARTRVGMDAVSDVVRLSLLTRRARIPPGR